MAHGKDAYERLCAILDNEVLEERIDKPIRDAAQDGWVRTLESRKRKGKKIHNAQSVEELEKAYREDAGLVVTAFRNAYEDAQRKLRGHDNKLTPKKTELLRRAFSLDETDESLMARHELIEDVAAAVAFEDIESQDFLYTDPRYVALSDDEKAAVRHFTLAWLMQEAGIPVPNKVQQQISRNRKKYGLALELKRGPR
jgi:hypothetical protein